MAGNETVYQRNFYLAEGAMMEAVDRLDNTLDIRGNAIDWMDKAAKSLRIDTVETYWDNTTGIIPEILRCRPGAYHVRRRRGRGRAGLLPRHGEAPNPCV